MFQKSQSYSSVLTDFNFDRNLTKEEEDLATAQFYEMDAQATVAETVDVRISDWHW